MTEEIAKSRSSLTITSNLITSDIMAAASSVPTTTEVKREASAQAASYADQGEQALDELVDENGPWLNV